MGENTIFANKFLFSLIMSTFLIIHSYKNDISVIKRAASMGFRAIIFLLFLIIYDLLQNSFYGINKNDHLIRIREISDEYENVISNISCIILSFSFHTYTFSIYECLEKKSMKIMMITTAIGIFASMLIYLLIGSIGYILYVDSVDEYYILNFAKDDGFQRYFQSIAFCLNVIMSFPLTFFSMRHYLVFLTQIILTKLSEKLNKNKTNNDEKLENMLEEEKPELEVSGIKIRN